MLTYLDNNLVVAFLFISSKLLLSRITAAGSRPTGLDMAMSTHARI